MNLNLDKLARDAIKVSTIIIDNKSKKFGSKAHINALASKQIKLTPFQSNYFIFDPINNKIYVKNSRSVEAVNNRIVEAARVAHRERLAPIIERFRAPVAHDARAVGNTGNIVHTVKFNVDGDIDAAIHAAIQYIKYNVKHGVGTYTPNKFMASILLSPPNNIISTVFAVQVKDLRRAINDLLEYAKGKGDQYMEIADVNGADQVWISYYVNVALVEAGRGNNVIAVDVANGFKIINIVTKSRCGFSSLLLSVNPQFTPAQVKAKTQDLTRRYMRKYPQYNTYQGLTFSQLNDVAQMINVNLTIYDKYFNVVASYDNKQNKTSYIQYSDQHYNPLVSADTVFNVGTVGYNAETHSQEDEYEIIEMKNDDITYNPNYLAYDIETFMTNDDNGNLFHKPYAIAVAWHDLTEYNSRIHALLSEKAAIETRNKEKRDNYKNAYISGNPIDRPTYESFDKSFDIVNKNDMFAMPINHIMYYGIDCINKFLDHIFDNGDLYNGKYLYAHNGAKFDLNIIIESGLISDDRFTIVKACDLNNAFISLTLKFGKNKVTFLDSCRQFPASLDSFCREMGTPIRKLTGDVDHAAINADNFNDVRGQVERYLYHDVASLLQSIDAYSLTLWETYRINMVSCLTSASLSKKIFFTMFNDPVNKPIFYMPMDVDRYIRSSYYGGRVECFRHGDYSGRFYYYDFTSLYPAAATGLLPYGKPTFTNEININDFYGFVRCRVRTTSHNFTPLHGIKVNGTLNFPYIDNWTELTLFSEEIKESIRLGLPYEYQFIDGYKFNSGNVLADFMRTAFKAKNDAKRAGNTALSQASKIVANSGYGFFGLRVEGRDAVKIVRNNDFATFADIADSGSYRSHCQVGNYSIVKVCQDMDTKSYNVAIASAITSLARCMLYNAIYDIQQNGGRVFYCDTDSIITDYHIESSSLKMKYMEHNGDALGELKNEFSEKYQKLAKKLGGTLGQMPDYFTELIISGCKFYACRGSYAGHNIDIVKCKGLREADHVYASADASDSGEFDFNAFRRLHGVTFYQNQKQGFNCSATAKLNGWKITSRSIVKSFQKVYNKGTFNNDGSVTALTL